MQFRYSTCWGKGFFQLFFFSRKEWQGWGYLSPSARSQIKQGLAVSCSSGINNGARIPGKAARAAFQKTRIKGILLSWIWVISKWIWWVSGRRTPLKPERLGCVWWGWEGKEKVDGKHMEWILNPPKMALLELMMFYCFAAGRGVEIKGTGTSGSLSRAGMAPSLSTSFLLLAFPWRS